MIRRLFEGRSLSKALALGVALLSALFHIVVLNFIPISPSLFRPLHVLSVCLMVFLIYDYKGKTSDSISLDRVLLIVMAAVSMIYAIFQVEAILIRGGISTTRWDVVMGIFGVIVIFEATRRTVGIALPIIALAFTSYAFWGKYVPGFFGHRGYSLNRVITTLYTYDGMFGMSVDVVATFVVMFIIFGSFLNITGAGEFMLELAKSLTGKQRGGPAKIATVASGLFGSISGSAVANVVGTGTFTIPLMKKMGYEPYFAGAVEAAASTGGQFMPPIMAAAGFLMAEILGVPYLRIMKAAIVPAILYFLVIWVTVDLRAARMGLKGLRAEEIPSLKLILKKQGYLLIPLVVLVFSLVVLRQSPIRSAFWSSVICMVITLWQRKDIKMALLDIVEALYEAMSGVAGIAGACACAGIVIGAIGLTGLSLKIAAVIISASGGRLLVALLLSMITAIIFGMGLPTSVSYILCVTILAPVLIELSVVPIGAHMFIFFFACLSGLTPPVALAAFAGAGIAGADPMQTGWTSCKLAMAGFLLPYMFVYSPVLLMIDSTLMEIVWASVTALLGCCALAASLEGWLLHQANPIQRILLLFAALTLIRPGMVTDALGGGAFVAVVVWQVLERKKFIPGLSDATTP